MDKALFKASLLSGAEKMGISVDEPCFEKLESLYELMLDENQRQNLTRIVAEEEVAEKHMLDSITLSSLLPNGASIADIGCGAGFPTLPVACHRADVKICAVDSTEKRIRYVNATAASLGLSNVNAIAARAEELGKNAEYRESFDVCTARAVAALNVLCEYCLPLLKVGGAFIAMKANAKEEIENAKKAIAVLGGKIKQIKELRLPFSDSERTIIVIEKIKPTPLSYPRAGGAISKKPL